MSEKPGNRHDLLTSPICLIAQFLHTVSACMWLYLYNFMASVSPCDPHHQNPELFHLRGPHCLPSSPSASLTPGNPYSALHHCHFAILKMPYKRSHISFRNDFHLAYICVFIHKWSPTYNGLTYDFFFTLQRCKSDTRSVETVPRSLNFDLSLG